MIKETELRALLLEFAEQFSQGETYDELIDELMCKVYPPKAPKAIVHDLVGDKELDEEEWVVFNEDPEYFIETMDLDVPSFSYGKDRQPTAYEGQELFVKLSGRLFKFQIFEGECIEATWSDTYYETNYANVVEIPTSEIGNYNLKKYNRW